MVYLLKIAITSILVVSISELAKRFSLFAAILASLPLTSILAMIWLYIDTKSIERVSNLSIGIFWMVLPSLLFFIVFPLFVKINFRFQWALLLSIIVMFISYTSYAFILKKIGINI